MLTAARLKAPLDRSRQRGFEQKLAKEAKFLGVRFCAAQSSLRTRGFSTVASRSAQSAALDRSRQRGFEQKLAKEAKFLGVRFCAAQSSLQSRDFGSVGSRSAQSCCEDVTLAEGSAEWSRWKPNS